MTEQDDTIFGKIIRKEIPADIVFESDTLLAFRDINPQSPVHILIIPKQYIKDVSSVEETDREVLGDMFLLAAKLAKQEGIEQSGYRLVVNNGSNAGQTVFHLHLHLMGGRDFEWPPG